MTRVYNRSEVKARRQDLRREATKPERVLWSRLNKNQVGGARFRRQYSVGPYVLDFYCPALKLAVEIDGETHRGSEAEAYDGQRQAYVESMGIRFLRFTNAEVVSDPDAVIGRIAER